MNRILISAAAIAAVASMAACNKADNTGAGSTSNEQGNPAVNAAQDATSAAVGAASASTVGANTTEGFVNGAAISDMYEVEAGKLAQQKSKNADIKAFAAMMVKDHTALSSEMKAGLPKSGASVTPPSVLDERRQGLIDNLKAASAADFDKTYMNQQVAAHSEALTLHQGYADHGDNTMLKTMAAKVAPKVQTHLDKAKSLEEATDKQG